MRPFVIRRRVTGPPLGDGAAREPSQPHESRAASEPRVASESRPASESRVAGEPRVASPASEPRPASAASEPHPAREPHPASEPHPARGAADPAPATIRSAARRLQAIAGQITSEEFIWQDAHFSRDSRYGRELLYLMAYNGWIRATTENVSVSRSDAVDTSITVELDLEQITHEAFHSQQGDLWLPLLVLPVPGRGRPVQPSRNSQAEQPPHRMGPPRSAQEARSVQYQPKPGRLLPGRLFPGRLFPGRRTPGPAAEPGEIAELAEPDPFSSLTVTDATGDLLPIVQGADVRHWISAAMAEIIVNMAVARWAGTPSERPTATRDQRLILSAAIYRMLRPATEFLRPRQTTRATPGRPAGGRIAHAKHELDTLLGAYIRDYDNYRNGRTQGGQADAEADTSFGHGLTQRAVQVLDALAESAIVVVPVDRQRTPTVLTVNLPTRRLHHFPLRGMAPPRAEMLIDLLLPSADAGRQVRVSLPDGVSLDFSAGGHPVEMVIEVEPPQPLMDLRELMKRLAGAGAGALAAATRQCLADLAVAKAGTAIETLQQHVLRSRASPRPDPESATRTAASRLRTLRAELGRLSERPDDDDRTRKALATVTKLWDSGSWLPRPLRRRTSAETLGPRLAVGRAAFVEDLAQRGTARRGWINVRVEITDAEFFSIARFAGILSVILMSVVFAFLTIAAAWHRDLGDGSPSPEVLASVLTLFSAIQAGRIERLDRSTLRGMISSGANWLIVASVLPTFILAVDLAFNASGWVPVCVAAAAIFVQLMLQLFMWGRPIMTRKITRRRRRQWLWTSPPPDYARWGVLQSHWWRNTTADALKLGRQAEGFVVWEHSDEPPSLTSLLVEARQASLPSTVTAPGRARRILSRVSNPILVYYGDRAPAGPPGAAISGSGRRHQGEDGSTVVVGTDDPPPDPRPANILALLRSATAAQALTFVVFREEPAEKWSEGLDVRPVALDPDRLAPMDSPPDTVEVFLSLPARGGWPAVTHHPIRAVLKAAKEQRLIVLEADLPIPAPVADGYDRIWARVRVGLRDAEIRRLPAFLEAVERRIRNLKAVPCGAWVRTVPGAGLRAIVAAPPGQGTIPGGSAGHSRLVLASDIDVVACVTGAQLPEPEVPDWRVMALCADARAGVEADILRWMGRCWPGMRLAGLTYAVLHGTAVMLMLVHQPDGRTKIKGDLDRLTRRFTEAHVTVLYDEWQSPKQLGLVTDQPLLGVHIDAPDQPGSLLDTLNSLYDTLSTMLPGDRDLSNSVWHALLRTTSWSASRLTIRLPATQEEVTGWDRAKFEEIERLTRQRAIRAAAIRRAASLTGDRLGAPEDTVISVNLVRFPEKPPALE